MEQSICAQTDQIEPDAITVSFYLKEIPAFVADELQQLYGQIHSSLPFLQCFKKIDGVGRKDLD